MKSMKKTTKITTKKSSKQPVKKSAKKSIPKLAHHAPSVTAPTIPLVKHNSKSKWHTVPKNYLWYSIPVCMLFVIMLVVTSCLLAINFVPVAVIAPTLTTTTTKLQTPSWLFSLTAQAGTLTPTKTTNSYTLTLNTVDPTMIAFADRPDRDVTVTRTANFMDAWTKTFGIDAPNAVLVEHADEHDVTAKAHSIVFKLTHPIYDAGNHTLTFTVTVLDKTQIPARLAKVADTAYDTQPASFNTVSLFIDNAGGWDGGI